MTKSWLAINSKKRPADSLTVVVVLISTTKCSNPVVISYHDI
jgi:hypothetical protein